MSSSLTPLGPQTLGQWTSEQEQMVLAALAAQVQQANQGATQAQGQYQQAAAAPMPQISPFAAFAPSLLGGIASVISGNPTYHRDANAGVEASRDSIAKSSMQNLQAQEQNWKQKAEAARQLGNIQAEMEARTKLDGIYKRYETIQKATAERAETERLDKTLKANREIALIRERGDNSREQRADSREQRLSEAGTKAAINTLTDNVSQDKDINTFRDVRDGYQRVTIGAGEKNAVGDLSLLFGYMKILDPTSVVRESEYANAENTAGVPENIRRIYNKVLNGSKLTQTQRDKFSATARRLYEGKKQSYDKRLGFHRRQAKAYGVDPDLIINDMSLESAPATADPLGIR